MKLLRIQLLVLSAVLAGCASGGPEAVAPAAPGEPTRLTVHVAGITDSKGTINVGLYSNADGWLTEEGVAYGKVAPVGHDEKAVNVVFDSIPAGIYAVSLFQDVNDSKTFDRGALGIPAEPWGMSNNAVGVMGPPSFKDAAVTISAPETTIEISLRTGLGWPTDGGSPHHAE